MLFSFWRKISVKRMTFITPLFIKSASTLPAPTDGSWSLSPTTIILVPGLIALNKLYASITSTMDASSIISASHSNGFFELRAKPFPASLPPYSRSLWIVLASKDDVSVIRIAALPVGAAISTFLPALFKMLKIVYMMVVLPVPGPPVMTLMFPFIHAATASLCVLLNFMPFLTSASSMRLSTLTRKSLVLAFDILFI